MRSQVRPAAAASVPAVAFQKRPQARAFGMENAGLFPIRRALPFFRRNQFDLEPVPVAEQPNAPIGHLLNTANQNPPPDPKGHALFKIVQAANTEVLNEHLLPPIELRFHCTIGNRHETKRAFNAPNRNLSGWTAGTAVRFVAGLKAGNHGREWVVVSGE